MVMIEIKIIDESKNKSLLTKMSNKKMSIKRFFKLTIDSVCLIKTGK